VVIWLFVFSRQSLEIVVDSKDLSCQRRGYWSESRRSRYRR